jgi:GTP-binding protein EngB required for normal cell division
MAAVDATRPTGTEQLRSYVAWKQEVVRLIRLTYQFLKERGNKEGVERVDELMRKLAEDRFNLVVLGQFKRGKSSLINAVVGKELMPTAIIPLTSVVTALRYGETERAVLRREGFALPQIVPVSEIAAYVTERGNPRNEKRVLSAEVEVPVPFLRRGLFFIDTPGVGSMHEHNTATTYRFLPEADAVIFITSPEPPLTETELEFLATIRQHVRKIFFVLNKIDQLTSAEREEAIAFTEQTLKEHLGGEAIYLYPLSARLGLQAQLEGDAAALERSGLPALQDALARFLAVERSQLFLVAVLDRALRLLSEEAGTLALEAHRRTASPTELTQQLERFRARVQALEQAQNRLFHDLRRELREWVDGHLEPAVAAVIAEEREHLKAALPAAASARAGFPTRDFARRLEGWLWDALRRRFEAWLADQTPGIQERVEQGLGERQEALQHLSQQVEQAAMELFQLPSGSTLQAEEPAQPPNARDFPRPELPLNAFRVSTPLPIALRLVPRCLAQRWICQRLRERLPSALGLLRLELVGALRGAIARAIDAAEEQWRRRVDAMRHRIEAAVMPQSPARSPSRDGTSGASIALEEAAGERLRDLRTQMENLRDGLVRSRERGDRASMPATALPPEPGADQCDRPSEARERACPPPALPPPPPAAVPAPSSRVQAGLRSRSCPICVSVLKEVYDFFCSWQYQLATQEAAQQAYAESHGFCHFHAWALEGIASPRALSLGLPALAERTAREVREIAGQPGPERQERLGDLSPRSADCRACQARDRAADEYGRYLIRWLTEPAARKEYSRSQGICLPHLQSILAMEPPPEVADFLFEEQARHLEETAEEMHSYAVKFEARHRDLFTSGEEDATRRVLVHLLGEREYR